MNKIKTFIITLFAIALILLALSTAKSFDKKQKISAGIKAIEQIRIATELNLNEEYKIVDYLLKNGNSNTNTNSDKNSFLDIISIFNIYIQDKNGVSKTLVLPQGVVSVMDETMLNLMLHKQDFKMPENAKVILQYGEDQILKAYFYSGNEKVVNGKIVK